MMKTKFALTAIAALMATTAAHADQKAVGDFFEAANHASMSGEAFDMASQAYKKLNAEDRLFVNSQYHNHGLTQGDLVDLAGGQEEPNAIPVATPVSVATSVPQATPQAQPSQRTPSMPVQEVPQPMKAPVASVQTAPQRTPSMPAQEVPQPMKAPVMVAQSVPQRTPVMLEQATPEMMKAPSLVAQSAPVIAQKTPAIDSHIGINTDRYEAMVVEQREPAMPNVQQPLPLVEQTTPVAPVAIEQHQPTPVQATYNKDVSVPEGVLHEQRLHKAPGTFGGPSAGMAPSATPAVSVSTNPIATSSTLTVSKDVTAAQTLIESSQQTETAKLQAERDALMKANTGKGSISPSVQYANGTSLTPVVTDHNVKPVATPATGYKQVADVKNGSTANQQTLTAVVKDNNVKPATVPAAGYKQVADVHSDPSYKAVSADGEQPNWHQSYEGHNDPTGTPVSEREQATTKRVAQNEEAIKALAKAGDQSFNTLASGVKQAQDTGAYAQARANQAYANAEANREALANTNAAVAQNSADIQAQGRNQAAFETKTNREFNRLDNKIKSVEKKANRGIAGANALAGLPQLNQDDTFGVAAAVGGYEGESAVALGGSAHPFENKAVTIKAGVTATNGGNYGWNAGVGYSFR